MEHPYGICTSRSRCCATFQMRFIGFALDRPVSIPLLAVARGGIAWQRLWPFAVTRMAGQSASCTVLECWTPEYLLGFHYPARIVQMWRAISVLIQSGQ